MPAAMRSGGQRPPEAESYLRRLRRALRSAPASERQEIVDNVTAHIDAALDSTTCPEADIGRVLEELGTVDDIVAAATPNKKPSSAERDVLALVILELGGVVVPFVGWVIGVVLVWSSRTWSSAEKWVATLIVPGGCLASVVAWMFLPGSEACMIGAHAPNGSPLQEVCVKHGFVTPMWVRILVAVTLAAVSLATACALLRIGSRRRSHHDLHTIS